MRGLVLSLCDYTGVMVEPWAEAGYWCVCVDLKHPAGLYPQEFPLNGISFMGADLLGWIPPLRSYSIVFAFPPCTALAVSGSRWMKGKGLSELVKALALVDACRKICEASGVPYFIENPVSTISTYWREPDYTFDPCEFGDPYKKKTCLWTGGGFIMPKGDPLPLLGIEGTRVAPTEGSKMHRLPPSERRAEIRSETPPGFARAVFEANEPLVRGTA